MFVKIKIGKQYAGSEFKVNRFGEFKPGKFSPVSSQLLARVYDVTEDKAQLIADMEKLAAYLNESINQIEMEKVA